MIAVEFTTELNSAGTLAIPAEVAAQLPTQGTARIIVLPQAQADDSNWQAGAYAQFLQDDPAEDAIYDSLR